MIQYSAVGMSPRTQKEILALPVPHLKASGFLSILLLKIRSVINNMKCVSKYLTWDFYIAIMCFKKTIARKRLN